MTQSRIGNKLVLQWNLCGFKEESWESRIKIRKANTLYSSMLHEVFQSCKYGILTNTIS